MKLKKAITFLGIFILGYLITDTYRFNKALLEYFPGLGIALVPNKDF
ncbi:MAG: hypothetical protein ACLS90_08630 [Clostridia bacterium]